MLPHNRLKNAGHTVDATTGFTYMNARYYEPNSARFLTPDSYTGNPYNPNTQNVYSYAGNNPVNYVDPTGHTAIGVALSNPVGFLIVVLLFGAAGACVYFAINPDDVIIGPSLDINLGTGAPNTPEDADQTDTDDNEGTGEVKPSVEYPNDPTKPPGEGWEWKGDPDKGSYYNSETGETLRPDLNHPDPIPPHWDYRPGRGMPWYRWFPDGTLEEK